MSNPHQKEIQKWWPWPKQVAGMPSKVAKMTYVGYVPRYVLAKVRTDTTNSPVFVTRGSYPGLHSPRGREAPEPRAASRLFRSISSIYSGLQAFFILCISLVEEAML